MWWAGWRLVGDSLRQALLGTYHVAVHLPLYAALLEQLLQAKRDHASEP